MSNPTLRRFARAGLAAGSALLLAAFLIGGAVGEWLFAGAAGALPVLLVAQSCGGADRSRGRLVTLAGLLVLIESGLLGMLALRGDSDSWIAGLPAATLLIIATLGIGCLVLTVSAYAAWFDSDAGNQHRDR